MKITKKKLIKLIENILKEKRKKKRKKKRKERKRKTLPWYVGGYFHRDDTEISDFDFGGGDGGGE
jgi:hypothetical protein